jgi:hypothetical protein
MPLEPFDWNVVIAGFWNRAILTPGWIANNLFGVPEGTELQIDVPVHVVGPIRVTYNGIVVVPTAGQLIVEAQASSYQSLGQSMAIALRAVNELPKTPFGAVGYNIRFKGPAADRELQPALDLLRHTCDDRFALDGREIRKRNHSWAVPFLNGIANLAATLEDDVVKVTINYELQAHDQTTMAAWLTTPIEQIESETRHLLGNLLGLEGVLP